MAARKRHRVLYEVFRPTGKPGDAGFQPRLSGWSRETGEESPADEGGLRPPSGPTASPGPAGPGATERRQVTISAPTLTVLIAAAIVLLAVAFSGGRRYGSARSSAAGEAKPALAENEATDTSAQAGSAAVIEPLDAAQATDARRRSIGTSDRPADSTADAAREAPGAGPRRITLQTGYHYVIVQHFRKSSEWQAALAAARYLEENGIACATLTGADIRLIATEPFLIKQQDAAAARQERQRGDRLLQRIRRLGQEYSKQLAQQGKKGYTFSECYLFEVR